MTGEIVIEEIAEAEEEDNVIMCKYENVQMIRRV